MASETQPFKILSILGNALGHPEPHEFNSGGIGVVCLPANSVSNSTLDQEVIRTFKAHDTWYPMGRIVNLTEHHKVWKDFAIEDAVVVIERKP